MELDLADLSDSRREMAFAPESRPRSSGGADASPSFDATLRRHGLGPLVATGIEVLQVNLGKLCNLTCLHCHVDAGPTRREAMSLETARKCLDVLARTNIATLDITGGAPEMNPCFRMLVRDAAGLGRRVVDRCNLTILEEPSYEDLAEFLAKHRVEIVASLPCYLEDNCDAQRGDGVFKRSIAALKRLNAFGYGRPVGENRGGLTLTLVHNPIGDSLPPPQAKLEVDYRRHLRERYGVEFTRLYTITNMPIARFLKDLQRRGRYDDYMRTLLKAFNPATAANVMCRTTLSVDWRGYLYDCDFNQMLDLPLAGGVPRHVGEFDWATLTNRPIATDRHCFGCTAGCGSSCRGAIVG